MNVTDAPPGIQFALRAITSMVEFPPNKPAPRPALRSHDAKVVVHYHAAYIHDGEESGRWVSDTYTPTDEERERYEALVADEAYDAAEDYLAMKCEQDFDPTIYAEDLYEAQFIVCVVEGIEDSRL